MRVGATARNLVLRGIHRPKHPLAGVRSWNDMIEIGALFSAGTCRPIQLRLSSAECLNAQEGTSRVLRSFEAPIRLTHSLSSAELMFMKQLSVYW